jgi:hypothetical protein
MLDSFHEKKKKEYELKLIELMIGRCYTLADVSDPRKKINIRDEAEVFYRDHIHGVTGAEASHHNVKTRFPNLNDRVKTELSVFAEKMAEAGEDIVKIEATLRNFGLNVNFSNDKLKSMIRNNG